MDFQPQSGRIRLGQVMLTLTSGVLALVAFAFFRAPDDAVEVERRSAVETRVVVSEVGMQPFELSVSVVGRVSPWREVSLGAEVGGRVSEVHVDLGDRVAAGELLVSIETDNYETALREAEAAELRAQARLEESEASLARMEALRTRGAISEREYEAALATKRAGEADLSTAEAGLERARDNLGDTSVTAPFSGTIVERHVDRGALVSGDRTLVTLADLDTVAIEVGLTEREIFFVREASTAFIESTNRPGLVAQGSIDGSSERANAATGTYLVRILVRNDGAERFLGGMVVNVEIPYAELDAVATVPAAAVRMPDEDPHIFVVRDGRALRVDIDVIARQDDRFGVRARNSGSGDAGGSLALGDLVVVVGQTQLIDGSVVSIASQR